MKPGQVQKALDNMAKELECIHSVVDQLIGKLEPIRLEKGVEPRQDQHQDKAPERSLVARRLFELADGLTGQRQRLEHLNEEVEL